MYALYKSGVLISFLISLYRLMNAFAATLSIMAANMELIGLHYSPWTGTFVSKRTKVLGWAWFVLDMLFVAPLLSWISVAFFSWHVVVMWTNRAPEPERIREMQYRVANCRLSKEEMENLNVESATLLGPPVPISTGSDGSSEDDADGDDPDELILDPGEWYSEIRLNRGQKRYHSYGHTPDCDGIFDSDYEYRIEGTKVFERLLEDQSDHYGIVEFAVKDNVVLEHEIRQHAGDSDGKLGIYNIEDRLKDLREAVQWHELGTCELKFFILSRHPELLPPVDARRLFRQELERLKVGVDALVKKATEAGAVLHEEKDGFYRLCVPNQAEGVSSEKLATVLSEDSLKSYGISFGEFGNSKGLILALQRLLGEKK
jgi:hypothetical protein